ncbi:MAG: hypothetical protein R2746_14670 [Acidimicrobiales bacterium]
MGAPLLIFGHPEVYILILPTFGIVSEVILVFARKADLGYPSAGSLSIAGRLHGLGRVGPLHSLPGVGPISVAAFSISTMFIGCAHGRMS